MHGNGKTAVVKDTKTYNTCKDLVYGELNRRKEAGVSTNTIASISAHSFDKFFFELSQLSYLCKRPVKYSTVNRYLEQWVKAQLVLEALAS